MKNKKISVKTIILIVFISIIVSLILINLNYKNSNILGKQTNKEQLEETTDNAYVDMKTHLSELEEATSNITKGTFIKLSEKASNSFSINVGDYYDGDLSTLTADNFICALAKQTVTGTGGNLMKGSNVTSASASKSITKKYDPSTGVFTASIPNASVTAYCVSQGLCAYGEDFTTWTGQFTARSSTTFIPYLIVNM